MKKKSLIFLMVIQSLLLGLFPMISEAITVSTTQQLVDAIAAANSGGDNTIILQNGTYTLDNMLWVAASNVTVRSASGNRADVIIEGRGMTGTVTHIFNVAGSHFTVRDVTLRLVSQHAVQLQIDVDSALIQNVHFIDTGEQMFKAAYDPTNMSLSSDNGIVENCFFEYSAGIGPQWYIGGIDVHNGKNWIVRNNAFSGIRSPSGDIAEHAIHFWSSSENTLVERNIIINCDRGIGFGMGDRGHIGGIIRNNMIYHNAAAGFNDAGIILESAVNASVYNNTVYHEHSYPNAIEYRFGATTGAFIANNLTNRAIAQRDGASGTVSHNVTNAQAGWFVNTSTGDLHLNSAISSVVDQGMAISGLTSDFDGDPRPQGAGIDIGADEYLGGTQVPSANVMANGSDGPLTITSSTPLSVTVSLDAGSYAGTAADWWIAADTTYGWYYYVYPTGWYYAADPAYLQPAYQGALFTLTPVEVLNITGLPAGTFVFYFAVDTVMNGQIDFSVLYYDGVIVNVTY